MMLDKSPRPKSRSSAKGKSTRPKARPADLMENFNLERAMGGAAKRERMDAEEGKKNKGKKYKDGGCVMAGRGGKYKGMM